MRLHVVSTAIFSKHIFDNRLLSTLCLDPALIDSYDNFTKADKVVNSAVRSPLINYTIIKPQFTTEISKQLIPILKHKPKLYYINPGNGELLKRFIEDGLNDHCDINIIESKKSCIKNYQDLIAQKRISQFNIYHLKHSMKFRNFKRTHWPEKENKHFSEIWTKEPVATLFGVIPYKYEAGFLHNSILQLFNTSPDSFYSHGRIEFLFYVSGREATYIKTMINDKPPYPAAMCNFVSTAYKLFYDIEFLDERPLDNFTPDLNYLLGGKRKFDYSHMHLISMTPKPDLYRVWKSPERISNFIAFVRIFLRRPKGTTLTEIFEKWMGPHGFATFVTKCKQHCGGDEKSKAILSKKRPNEFRPEEIAKLFTMFETLYPDYNNCFGAQYENEYYDYNYQNENYADYDKMPNFAQKSHIDSPPKLIRQEKVKETSDHKMSNFFNYSHSPNYNKNNNLNSDKNHHDSKNATSFAINHFSHIFRSNEQNTKDNNFNETFHNEPDDDLERKFAT